MTRVVGLVHGYGDLTLGRANFIRLIPELQAKGFRPQRIELPWSGASSMEANVEALSTAIMHIQESTGQEKIHLIGHSVGGLTTIAYSKLFPHIASYSLEKVIALGAPLRGTRAANVSKFYAPLIYYGTKTARQISYESEYVMNLRRLPLPIGPDFHAIAARHDSHYVSPWDSALFLLGATKYLVAPWDKEVVIDGEKINIIRAHAGHMTMVVKKPVINAIIKILEN